MYRRFHRLLPLLACLGAPLAGAQTVDDSRIAIRTAAQVEQARASIVQYIWGENWSTVRARPPSAVVEAYRVRPGDGLPATKRAVRIEKIVVDMTVPASAPTPTRPSITHTSTAYVFLPASPNGNMVIVHNGHSCDFNDEEANLDELIDALLKNRFGVVAMRMPQYQRLSDCKAVPAPAPCPEVVYPTHDAMFCEANAPALGSPLRFFLEPVARVLRYLEMKHPEYSDFHMVGLSGGGWTTTLYAAVDPRIRISIPVAGTIPNYLRFEPVDREQMDIGLHGVAGMKDLYLLGSYGAKRQQIQLFNYSDPCCFNFDARKSRAHDEAKVREYERDVQQTVFGLGPGRFSVVIDTTPEESHQVPLQAIEHCIVPVLRGKECSDGPRKLQSLHDNGK